MTLSQMDFSESVVSRIAAKRTLLGEGTGTVGISPAVIHRRDQSINGNITEYLVNFTSRLIYFIDAGHGAAIKLSSELWHRSLWQLQLSRLAVRSKFTVFQSNCYNLVGIEPGLAVGPVRHGLSTL